MKNGYLSLALLALLVIASACESMDEDRGGMRDESRGVEVQEGRDGSQRLVARLRALENEVANVTTELAWSGRFGSDGRVERAWMRGDRIFLEVWNIADRVFEVHAVDGRTGKPQWVVVLGDNPLARAPRASGDAVALMTENDAAMVFVDKVRGSRPFRLRAESRVIPVSDPVGNGDTVYVADYVSGRMTAISGDNGVKGWDFITRGTCVSAPVLSNGLPRQLLIYGTDAREIVALEAKGVSEVPPRAAAWRHVLGGAFTVAPTYATIGAEGERRHMVYFPCEDGFLYACDPATGLRTWVLRTDEAFRSPAVVLGDRVYARNASRLFCLDAASGQRLWTPEGWEEMDEYERTQLFREPKGWETARRVLGGDDEHVFLMMGDDRVARVHGSNGEEEMSARLGSFDFFLTNEATGTLIVGTRDGYFVSAH